MFATAASVRVRRILARTAIAGLILIGMVTATAGQSSAQVPASEPSSVGWYYPGITPFDPMPMELWYGWNPWYRPYYSWYRPVYPPGWFGSS
ncbi:hypothetical protein J2W56_002402 [Nocardia kruczakiae]|uniref:Uncharacterized protein n=1 Tax=Nocardia kruczakiae TaxID=261477 RepID=A0ABU1XF14_9NOCA|nr:hypothetical protein [Nocardia kruczakiae]MDR7168671.1 hypothetical protein [Nocardia kruczakiae]